MLVFRGVYYMCFFKHPWRLDDRFTRISTRPVASRSFFRWWRNQGVNEIYFLEVDIFIQHFCDFSGKVSSTGRYEFRIGVSRKKIFLQSIHPYTYTSCFTWTQNSSKLQRFRISLGIFNHQTPHRKLPAGRGSCQVDGWRLDRECGKLQVGGRFLWGQDERGGTRRNRWNSSTCGEWRWWQLGVVVLL